MIRPCQPEDFEVMWEIINTAAQAYKEVIPADCWQDPYMSKEELAQEIKAGVNFWGYEEDKKLIGVMGLQEVQDVALIRHAYVQPKKQNKGIGGNFLFFLKIRPLVLYWSVRGRQLLGLSNFMKNMVFFLLKKKKKGCSESTGIYR